MWAAVAAWPLLLASLPPGPAFRLSGDVTPVKHTLNLSIDPGASAYEGEVVIEADLHKPTSIIWVNGRDLVPREARIAFGDVIHPAQIQPSGGEFLVLRCAAPVGPGRVRIYIRFQARLDEKQVLGAYRRKVDGDWYAYTTFTPIEARKAFPCFDEPRFKTPWDITIRVPPGNLAFSNAPAIAETQDKYGWTSVHFATTPPLPAEVVAFAVGPFGVYEGAPAGEGTPVRVLTPRARAAEGQAGAEATLEILPRLEAYTGIPYPYGKLDHVALPESAFGAVENPGLITYLSRELLTAPGPESRARTNAIRFLEAHEIAHQWFGDMVTQATWADVWLSEGFATWLSEKIMDQEQIPERAHLYAIASRERIMRLDGSSRARPVRVEVHDREGSKNIYNRMVYDKGASVLLMLEGWLGEAPVQKAARTYLQEHRFGSATTADFADDLKRASGTDPAPVIHAFLDLTGIPRVSGRVKCEGPSENGAKLEIHISGPAPVPVCWRGPASSKQCAVVDSSVREVGLSGCPAWTFLNAGGTGYYRSVWTAGQLSRLPLDQLTAAERLTLAYDLRALKTDRPAAHAVLTRLALDPEAEVASAAKEALK